MASSRLTVSGVSFGKGVADMGVKSDPSATAVIGIVVYVVGDPLTTLPSEGFGDSEGWASIINVGEARQCFCQVKMESLENKQFSVIVSTFNPLQLLPYLKIAI